MWDIAERAFQAYGRPLVRITSFKYLGWVLTEVDDDWAAVIANLRKARKSWAWMARIMVKEGARPRVLGIFFKAVVHAVLLFRSETWLLNPRMRQALGRFMELGYQADNRKAVKRR